MNVSKLEIIGALGLVLLVAVLMIGCITSTESGGSGEVDASYTISGSDIQNNADRRTDWFMPGPGTEYRSLIWNCGNLNGHHRSHIELTFKKVGGTWVLDSEKYESGNCR